MIVVARRAPHVAVFERVGEGVGQRVPEQVPVEEHLRMGGGVNGEGLDGEGVHGEGVWCGGGVLCDDRDGTLGYFVHV